MKTALVVGATGLIGKTLTHKLLNCNYYQSITLLVRKPLAIDNPKLIQLVVDFDHIDASKIIADDIFCCLGTTMKQAGSKQNFYKVDFTYPLNIAVAGLKNKAKQFLIVTALGANDQSLIYYNKVKGKVENALSSLGYPTLLIFRPSMLEGVRDAPERTGEKLGAFIMNLFSFIIPKKYKIIPGGKVAEAMIQMAQKNYTGKMIFESNELQTFNP